MTVVVIDYGSGNLRSVAKAFERAAADGGHREPVVVTAEPELVAAASRVVLPGVGAFGDCRRGIDAIAGLFDALEEAVVRNGRPFFGICVGMQLMAERGVEYGVHSGFGWIPGEVSKMTLADRRLKVPHMGWNTLSRAMPPHVVLDGLDAGAHVYFVHSYVLQCRQSAHVLAETDYGGSIVAAVGRDNIVGTQFHPEKSQAVGQRIIRNFLAWKP